MTAAARQVHLEGSKCNLSYEEMFNFLLHQDKCILIETMRLRGEKIITFFIPLATNTSCLRVSFIMTALCISQGSGTVGQTEK